MKCDWLVPHCPEEAQFVIVYAPVGYRTRERYLCPVHADDWVRYLSPGAQVAFAMEEYP